MNKKETRRIVEAATRCTKGQRESAVFLSLWSESVLDNPGREWQMILQFGYAVLLDKPIVVIAPRGARISANVRRVAHAVEFYEPDDQESMRAATLRALATVGLPVLH